MNKFLVFICLFGFYLPLKGQNLSPQEERKIRSEIFDMRHNLNILKAWHATEKTWKKKLIQTQARRDSMLEYYDQRLAQDLDLDQRIDSLKKTLQKFRLKNRNLLEGVVFKLQVQAAFRHPIDPYIGLFPGLSAYRDGRLNRYCIGHFYDYREAKQFSFWLKYRNTPSYIIAFKNGKRVRMLYNYTQE